MTNDSGEDVPQRAIQNPLLGEVVVQTPGRMNRHEGVAECPFCADLAARRWPADRETWIRPNDFPAMSPPLGECYVLLYDRQHDLTFAELTNDQAAAVVDLWQEVYQQLSPRYPCVMTFENAGEAIGQTQHHPHGQTYGTSFLPPVIAREADHFAAEHDRTGACLGCRLVAEESEGSRVVIDTPHWLGFIPSWARYPYETHLYFRSHVAHIGDLPRGGDAARKLATELPRLIRGMNALYDAPMPYMLALHQLADSRFHFHIEILPVGRAPGKLKFAASSEAAFGLWLNDSVPDAKAAELRRVMEHEGK